MMGCACIMVCVWYALCVYDKCGVCGVVCSPVRLFNLGHTSLCHNPSITSSGVMLLIQYWIKPSAEFGPRSWLEF